MSWKVDSEVFDLFNVVDVWKRTLNRETHKFTLKWKMSFQAQNYSRLSLTVLSKHCFALWICQLAMHSIEKHESISLSKCTYGCICLKASPRDESIVRVASFTLRTKPRRASKMKRKVIDANLWKAQGNCYLHEIPVLLSSKPSCGIHKFEARRKLEKSFHRIEMFDTKIQFEDGENFCSLRSRNKIDFSFLSLLYWKKMLLFPFHWDLSWKGF